MTALLRLAIVATAIAQLRSGDACYAGFCLAAVTVTLAPPIRRDRALALALLGVMVADMTFGNTLGMYARLPWLDKALHLAGAALLAAAAFTLLRRLSVGLAAVAAALIALGLGAVWELAEYGVDRVLARSTQHAPAMSALDDTMLDLAVDAAGATLGAALAATRVAARRWRAADRSTARSGSRSATPRARAPGLAARTALPAP